METEEKNLIIRMEAFLQRLSKYPNQDEFKKTPDNKAFYLPIDFVETSLDELFYGMWETINFRTQVISNEVTASIELRVLHPISKIWITRTGSASIQIMVDKAPENVTGQEKNRWALDIQNKKPNALDMGIPKLKADCIKNAAQSLGNIFGRNINRTNRDVYQPIFTIWTQKQIDNGTA